MITKLQARLAELNATINVLSAERDEVRNQIAQLNSKLKVGDRVTYLGATWVWEVLAIRPGYTDGSTPRLMAARIKKDGTPGAQVNELWVPGGKDLILVNP